MLDIQEWRALVSMPGEGGRIRVSIFSHTGFKTLAIPGWWGHPLWKHLGLADVFPFFQTYRRHSQFQPTSYVRSAGKSTKFGVFRIVECVLQFRSSRVELFLISNFRRVLNVVFFLVGDFPASEFYMPIPIGSLSHIRPLPPLPNFPIMIDAAQIIWPL